METGAAVDVVIVNWNAGLLLRECVAALAAGGDAERLHVIVVDNASTDGSAEGLKGDPARLTVLRNGSNRGFGAASNQGAGAGSAPMILFLNPDTRVAPDTVALACRHLEGHPDVGILGVRLDDEGGTAHRTAARRPTRTSLLGQALGLDRLGLAPTHFMTEWDHGDTRAVDQVMGAFLLVRRPLFERLGGFDERFFVYYEDVDLCARALDAGFAVAYFAEARAWHQGGGTSGQVRDRRLFYLLRGQALYAGKHFGRGFALLLLALLLAVQVPLRALHALVARSPREALEVLRGARLLLADCPALLRALRASP